MTEYRVILLTANFSICGGSEDGSSVKNSQAKDLHLSVTTDEREEKYEDVDEEEDEDGSKSALIDQVCAYLTTGKYKDSCDKSKKRMIRKKAQRFTMIEGVLHYKMMKNKKMIATTALFLLFLTDVVRAMSTGAPSAACADISPVLGHSGSSQLLANSPFSLNVSQLIASRGYTPGSTYTLVLNGGASQYRGLLVQGRSGSTPVGSFATGMLVQPACSNTAVTHVNNTLKNNVQLTWTAPPAGTGNVVFSYAVVVQNSGGVNEYYATLTSPAIAELGGAGGQACPVAPSSIASLILLVLLGIFAVQRFAAF
ncbi:hypothetical protein EMCRGX_G006155 [Ephydatia muelleri]